jgi:V/A-type H+/Na+-transporting ATPase subunit I
MIMVMSKIQIVGPKRLLDEVIKSLHIIGIVHIESIPQRIKPEDPYLKMMHLELDKAVFKERIEKILERIKGITLLLPVSDIEKEGFVLADITSNEFLEEVDRLENDVKTFHTERAGLLEEASSIERYEKILKGIAPLVTKLHSLSNFETIGITIDSDKEDILPLFESEINRITEGSCLFIVRDIDENIMGVVIAYPRQYDARLKSLISAEAISEIKLPQKYADITLFDALKIMVKRKGEIPALIMEIDSRLKGLSNEWYKKLIGVAEVLHDTIDELKALAYCAHTKFTFVITGWIPRDEFNVLSNTLKQRFGDNVMVREMEIREDEGDSIPVYIKNPALLRPFEIFINILPPPKYDSIDPTPYLALFFPTFFGLMLGDVGYGCILLIISLYTKRKFNGRGFIGNLASVFTISSLFAIVFGILFGEFFGDLGERLGIFHPIIFDRLKALRVFLMLAVGIGLGHVLLGYLLAIINYIHRRKVKRAAAKASALVLLIALFFIIAVLAKYLPNELMTAVVIIMTAALAVLILLEGIIGPLEVIKAVGNIFSYVRIMAIGTASVVLAIVANKLGGLTDNVMLGILMAGVIHTINIFLGIVGPTIHSLRLHYVEFFSIFYETGTRRYTPFEKYVK